MKIPKYSGGLATLVLLNACAAATPGHEEETALGEGSTATVSQGLSGEYTRHYVTYDEDEEFSDYSRQVCFLTGIRGELNQGIYLGSDTSYAFWAGAGNDGAGWVTCVPKSNFTVPTGSIWQLSPNGYSLYAGDAFSFIRGLDGDFAGGGEYIKVFQSSTTDTNSTWKAYSGDDGYVYGGAKSFLYGVPGARLVRLMGYNTEGEHARGKITSSGTFSMSVSTYSGYSSYWLTPQRSGICAYSKLGGDFNGGGEIANIVPLEGMWFLESIAGTGDVWATARCMAYNQT
jgi:hypothetical protein